MKCSMLSRTIWIVPLAASALGFALPARAEMRINDLQKVETKAFPESKWLVRKEADRLTIACSDCATMTAIDVQLSAAPPGMEDRIRDGETTAASMLEVCKQNAEKTGAECYGLKRADVKDAVGFVSDVKIFDDTYSATYTLYQGGSLLLMRCVGPSREEAKRVGNLAFREIAPQIVK